MGSFFLHFSAIDFRPLPPDPPVLPLPHFSPQPQIWTFNPLDPQPHFCHCPPPQCVIWTINLAPEGEEARALFLGRWRGGVASFGAVCFSNLITLQAHADALAWTDAQTDTLDLVIRGSRVVTRPTRFPLHRHGIQSNERLHQTLVLPAFPSVADG